MYDKSSVVFIVEGKVHNATKYNDDWEMNT